MKPKRSARMLGAATVMFALTQTPVFAGAWRLQLMGVKQLAASYAGAAAEAADASTVWFNPAGMTELGDGWTVTAGAGFVDLALDWRDAGSTSLLGQPMTGERSPDGGSFAVLPHVYAARRLADRWWAGFSFNAPYGLGTDYGADWVGRYRAHESTLRVFNLNPAVAWRAADTLSLAVGLDVQLADAVFSQRIDFGSIGFANGLPLAPQGADGSVHIEGDDTALAWNAGILWQASERTRLGLSYRSGTTQRIDGDADFTVPAGAEPLTAGGLVFADTTASADLPMPALAELSLVQAMGEDWDLLAGVGWTDWSRQDELVIAFGNPLQPTIVQSTRWSDTLRYSLGARWRLDERWTLRGGVAYEESPTPDATREPRIPEAPHRWIGLGATRRASDSLAIDFYVNHLFTDRARVDSSDPTAGRVAGQVDWDVNGFGVAATYRF